MSYISAFDDFDPKTGELPPVLSGTFAYIVHMARGVLNTRDSNTIRSALPALDWMLKRTSSALRKERIDDVCKHEEIVYFESPAATLQQTMKRYDIHGQDVFPNATWADYFAILALVIVARTVTAPEGTILSVMKEGPERDYLHLKIAAEWASDAMEAAAWANVLHAHEDVLESVLTGNGKRKISLQHQRAGIARHAHEQACKDGFVEFWMRGGHPSRREAAKRYIAKCEKQGINIPFQPTNRQRTLLDYLRKIEKARS